MQDSNAYFDTTLKDEDELDASPHKSPEDLVDQFGIRLSMLILCIALFIAAISVISRPSFEKCSALESVIERNTCYDQLRSELLKPPVKGEDFRY
jgi:hypothetical protein